MSKILKKVMVFGVFDPVRNKTSRTSADVLLAHRTSNGVDGLHEGHRYFLAMAREQGDELIAVVAPDEMVRLLKNKTPRYSEGERLDAVARLGAVTRAVLGDRVSGSYGVIKKHQPDIICLGYDQDALAEDLEEKMKIGAIPAITIRRLASHKSENMRSSTRLQG